MSKTPSRRGRRASTASATRSTAPTATTGVPTFQDRRDEEDALSATVYPDLPYPESQLVALAHSLLRAVSSPKTNWPNGYRLIRARLEA